MNVSLNEKQFVSIEYPGTVVDVKKMVQRLGGEEEISAVISDSKKRLELKFRQDDPYSKPAYGDRYTTAIFLVEVVRRRKKRKSNSFEDTESSCDNYDARFLGSANVAYKFKSMCDFQLLPLSYNDDGPKESLITKVVPTDLYPYSWLEENAPLFITPLYYSRYYKPQNVYLEGPAKNARKPVEVKTDPAVIGSSRRRRPGYAIFTSFECEEPCNEPRKEALEELQLYSMQLDVKQKLDELFSERPIWTKVAIMDRLKATDKQRIKFALNCTAYYFSNGPWRTSWVKFGYDPRKDPKSKIYQLMDFRVNAAIPIEAPHQRSRAAEYYVLPVKAPKSISKVPAIRTELLAFNQGNSGTSCDKSSNVVDELPSYILIPGRLPITRQCYFQICDVHIDEVQKLVHQNDGRERFCHAKDGWCDIGVLDKCREIVGRELKETAKKLACKTENQLAIE